MALLIVLFFVLDRAMSIGVFLPGFCVEDERSIMQGSVKMVREATLDPGTHKYPQLSYLITAGVYGAAYLGANLTALPGFESLESFSWHRSHYHFSFVESIVFGRLISVVLGAIAIWLLFSLARREFGELHALVAAFLLATTPSFLFSTQLLKNDVLVAVGVLLTLHASMRIMDRGALADYLLAGAAVGFCLAAKHHLPAVAPVLFAHFFRRRDLGWRAFFRPEWLLIVPACVLAFAILSPWTWLDLQGAINQGSIEWALQNELNPLLRRSTEHWWQAPVLFQFSSALPLALGIPLFALMLWGAFGKTPLTSHRKIIIWSYPAAFLAFMISMSELGVPHLYAPAVPFFALLAACAAAPWLDSESGKRRAGAVVLVAAVAIYNLWMFHGFTEVEDRVLQEPISAMERTHEPGRVDLAFVPYFPNPDMRRSVRFAPQFMLSEKLLEKAGPDRLLIHHAYFHSFLDNTELLDNPMVKRTILFYMELRAGKTPYREVDRWTGNIPTGGIYQALIPDLKGLKTSIYSLEQSNITPPG